MWRACLATSLFVLAMTWFQLALLNRLPEHDVIELHRTPALEEETSAASPSVTPPRLPSTSLAPVSTPPPPTPDHSIFAWPSRMALPFHRFSVVQATLNAMLSGRFVSNTTYATTDDYRPADAGAARLYANFTREDARRCLRGKRVFMTGTSWHRTLFWSLIRLIQPNPHTPIPPNLMLISSGEALVRKVGHGESCNSTNPRPDGFEVHPLPWASSTEQGTECLLLKDGMCKHPGPAGIDIRRCGMPQSGTWMSPDWVNATVHYQFKTYIRSPPVDTLIRSQLASHKWDLVWLSSGEWGAVYAPVNKDAGNAADAANAFLSHGIADVFKGWVVVNGNPSYNQAIRDFLDTARRRSDRILVFDESTIVKAGRAQSITEGHGYLGAVADTFTRAIFASLCNADS